MNPILAHINRLIFVFEKLIHPQVESILEENKSTFTSIVFNV